MSLLCAKNPWDATWLHYLGSMRGGLLGGRFRARSGRPVINVAGCPKHSGWVTERLMLRAIGALGPADLEPLARPRFHVDHLARHG